MNSLSNIEVRRCQPLLGTFVEITASGLEEPALQNAVTSAFGVIEKMQNLMSVHNGDSELARVNRNAFTKPVNVSPDTLHVLRLALKLAAESEGAFDCTVAPTLARWGLLPLHLRRRSPGNWRDIVLLEGHRVHFLRPLAVDLGGIAKGYAVDRAIEVLRGMGMESGCVNAGGDLRVFGETPAIIHLRHPVEPQRYAHSMSLRQSALATSSPCFSKRRWRRKYVSHLVNPKRHSAISLSISATVRARECWLADALTKVVLNAPRRAQALLAKYEAEAVVLRP